MYVSVFVWEDLITSHLAHKSQIPRGTTGRPLDLGGTEPSRAGSEGQPEGSESDSFSGDGSFDSLNHEGARLENSIQVRIIPTNLRVGIEEF